MDDRSTENTLYVSATDPDWSREAVHDWTDGGRQLLRSIRRYQYWADRSGLLARIMRKWNVFKYVIWRAVSGADIPLNTRIGGGFLMPHPNGIVIHSDSSIGPNCLVFQQVTIGDAAGGVPQIGGHVDIGAGAKILGNVRIGDHAKIGANAVVLQDVPAGATAVGIPAKIIASSDAGSDNDM